MWRNGAEKVGTKLEDQLLEEVKKFRYLGRKITKDVRWLSGNKIVDALI